MRETMKEKVNFAILVRSTPEGVYDALTTEEGLDGWFTTGSTVVMSPEASAEPDGPAGRIHFRWKEWGPERYSGENGGPVLEAKRPERFSFQWKVDSGGYDTTVEIKLERVAEGTIVRLDEHGYENSPTGLKDLLARATGWGEALTLMKFYVEHGVRY
jgi:uncharacterized protein YndB with AHSA1/START domain